MPPKWQPFGAPTTFRAGGNGDEEDAPWDGRALYGQVEELRKDVAKVMEANRQAVARAERAEKAEAVARACMAAMSDRSSSTKMDASVKEQYYEQLTKLTERVEQLEEGAKAARETHKRLTKELEASQQEAAASNSMVKALVGKNKSLEALVADLRAALGDQRKATETADAHLDKAYADLNRQEAASKAVTKAKDAAEAKNKEAELRLAQLQRQYDDACSTIRDLEDSSDLEQLQRDYAAVEDELEELRDSYEARDHEVTVKDARIARLEADLQKALEGKLSAEAAITAATAPTDAPPIFTDADDSLQAELAELSDSEFIDNASIMELDFAAVATIADIPPVASNTPKLSLVTSTAASSAPVQTVQPKLSLATSIAASSAPIQPAQTKSLFASTSAISIAPIEPQRTTISTQTSPIIPPETTEVGVQVSPAAPPKTSETAIQTSPLATSEIAVQVTPPKTAEIAIQTSPVITPETAEIAVQVTPPESSEIAIQVTPPETSEIAIQTSLIVAPVTKETAETATQTSPVVPSYETAMQTDNTAETDIVDTVLVGTPTSRKLFGLDFMSLLFLLLVMVPVFLFLVQRQMQLSAHGHGYYAQHRLSSGAFGNNGRYLFGIIPIGYDIGHSTLSENVARTTAGAIMSFEKWAGLAPTPFY